MEIFDTRDQLDGFAVNRISKMLGGQTCSLFMSGGSTPGPVYDRLSEIDLNWRNIYVAPADERWVDEQDKGSNARTIKETLVKNHARDVNFMPMKSKHQTPDEGALSIEMNYQQFGLKEMNKIEENVEKIFELESVGSKDWLTNKVDRCVTGKVAQQQCVGELQLPLSNCGVMALDYNGKSGVATSIGHAPLAGLINPKIGSINSIAKSLTNIIWAK